MKRGRKRKNQQERKTLTKKKRKDDQVEEEEEEEEEEEQVEEEQVEEEEVEEVESTCYKVDVENHKYWWINDYDRDNLQWWNCGLVLKSWENHQSDHRNLGDVSGFANLFAEALNDCILSTEEDVDWLPFYCLITDHDDIDENLPSNEILPKIIPSPHNNEVYSSELINMGDTKNKWRRGLYKRSAQRIIGSVKDREFNEVDFVEKVVEFLEDNFVEESGYDVFMLAPTSDDYCGSTYIACRTIDGDVYGVFSRLAWT